MGPAWQRLAGDTAERELAWVRGSGASGPCGGEGAGPARGKKLGRLGRARKRVAGWAKETGFWAWFWVSHISFLFSILFPISNTTQPI